MNARGPFSQRVQRALEQILPLLLSCGALFPALHVRAQTTNGTSRNLVGWGPIVIRLVERGPQFKAVAGGYYHSLALKQDADSNEERLRFLAPTRMPTTSATFVIDGQVGTPYVLERSIDLRFWKPVSRRFIASRPMEVSDSSSTNFASAFYRLRVP